MSIFLKGLSLILKTLTVYFCFRPENRQAVRVDSGQFCLLQLARKRDGPDHSSAPNNNSDNFQFLLLICFIQVLTYNNPNLL